MVQPTVLVTRRIPRAGLDLLRGAAAVRLWDSDQPMPRAELLRQAADADALLCLLTDRVDGELLAAAPRLRVAANMAVGYDNLDLAALAARGVVATNTPGVLTETTADLAFALLLASGPPGTPCCCWAATCTAPRSASPDSAASAPPSPGAPRASA
jgi:glyoxylate reductase